jgi:AbiV family abortive infection protein
MEDELNVSPGSSETKIDLESLRTAVRRCLDNAETLLDSAKALQNKNRNHIAYHLAALALEEVGKASLFLVKSIQAKYQKPDDGEDEDEESDIDLTDHRKKLFWAMLTPSLDAGIITPQDFNTLQEIASDIHKRRLGTLYADVETGLSSADITDQELSRIIGLTESRLNLEKLKRIKELGADELKLMEWFRKAVSDKQMQLFVLSEPSRKKLEEFSGDSRKWMSWLYEEITAAEAKSKELMEEELKRLEPTGVHANKPKWRIKIRLHTLSHSIRPKQLNDWNRGVHWIKLFPIGNDKYQLLVEISIPGKILLGNLWQAGLQMASMFVTALNIASVGYFWWYLPEFPASFYEEILDLDSKSELKVQRNENVMEGWKRTALKSNQLTLAGLIMAHCVSATNQQSESYARYAHGISLLAKNDIFSDFTVAVLMDFASAFRIALSAYGDWDGKPETFDQSMTSVFDELWRNPEALSEMKRLLQLSDELKTKQQPVLLDDAIKLKAFCDLYLISRAQREAHKTILQRKAASGGESTSIEA